MPLRNILLLITILAVSACANVISSGVQSGLVYFVAKHDQKVEKKRHKYTAIHKCIVPGKPDAIALADDIFAGTPLTLKYDKILSRTGEDIDPVEPHKLAYALYLIAYEINDSRAGPRLEHMAKSMKPEEIKEVQNIIADKYHESHLTKCFTVPEEYKIVKTRREVIREGF